MSLYVLDTDTLSLYFGGDALVHHRVTQRRADELAITVITVEEQVTGWYTLLRQSKTPKEVAHAYRRLADTVQALGRWQVLLFPESAIARYEQLRGMKLNVAKMDLRIAAITLENAATVVTRNVRDFGRVPGLVVENWAV